MPRASSTIRSPERTRSWSSAITTLVIASPAGRVAASSNRPSHAAVARACRRAGETRSAEAAQPEPRAHRGRPDAARVGGPDGHAVAGAAHLEGGGATAVPQRVGERLLARSGRPRRRSRRAAAPARSSTDRSTSSPSARNSSTSRSRSATPGAGASPSSSASSRITCSSRPVSTSARRPVSATSRSTRSARVGVGAHEVLRGRRLHDHGADRVGDDVVQLARDPVPLGAHRLARDQLLALLEQRLLGGEPPHQPAEDVRRDEDQAATKTTSEMLWSRASMSRSSLKVASAITRRRTAHAGRAPPSQRVDRDRERKERRRRVVELRSEERGAQQDDAAQRAEHQRGPAAHGQQRAGHSVDDDPSPSPSGRTVSSSITPTANTPAARARSKAHAGSRFPIRR